ncbi:hypothetical protein MHYP_G00338920 [Metynnis hypsauchen]
MIRLFSGGVCVYTCQLKGDWWVSSEEPLSPAVDNGAPIAHEEARCFFTDLCIFKQLKPCQKVDWGSSSAALLLKVPGAAWHAG